MQTDAKVDYKSTVRLPKTDFPMKGNLPTKEPQIIDEWNKKQIYQKLQKKNAGKQKFTLPDGPPYANGSIHIGHALNKTLKDIIIKYKNMKGFQAPFIPGWDCHGLPIEHAVLKDLGAKAKDKTDSELRALCRAEAQKWIDHQKPQFQRLGVLADWENPYYTMNPAYEAEQIREFARMYEKGLVYLGTKPVYWNWTLKTALADAEVEYHQHRSPSIYVTFNVVDEKTRSVLKAKSGETISLVIWTTTPWTLPANLGISVHPEFDYASYSINNNGKAETIVIAKSLKESFEKDTGLTLTATGFEIKGDQLDKLKARHPFIERDSLIMNGLHVTQDAGTGCVHTAPGHGADDYKVGLQYGLPILSPVNESGQYTDEVPEYQGINIFKANPLIVERLKTSNHLLGYKEFEHSYPHCWRSKTPLIFRATPQWFLGLDLEGKEVRKLALKSVDEIQFFPKWGEGRFRGMMEGRPDWCLSRQRIWGVPIPIFYEEGTGKPYADVKVMMKVADVIEKEGGIDAFYKHPASHYIGKEGYKQGKDIFDVWFDSGICHAAVQKRRDGLNFPADLYLEGSDQHRGWFNTSLISSLATNGVSPFKSLVTHGFVMDSQGMKMSKSKGNVVDPQAVAQQSGVEILRLWSVYEDYGQDLSCGKTELDRVTETYRRIRNSMRYLLGALDGFDAQKDSVDYSKLSEVDRWMLAKFYDLHARVTTAYDEYSFYKVYHALNSFFTVDLSAVYLDVLKDRLYTWNDKGIARRGSQTVIYQLADGLIRMMAPILSFIAEESYSYMPGKKEESVFLLDYPTLPAQWKNDELLARFDKLLSVRSDVQKQLELLRNEKTIGASLEAAVTITANEDLYNQLVSFDQNKGLYSDLREFLIVSEVVLKKGDYQIAAKKADGHKCARCWVYVPKLTASDSKYPEVCPKCVEALG